MITVQISDDALALACGADEVAAAFVAAGCTVERVSSWGMHWLEPLVEIDGMGWGRWSREMSPQCSMAAARQVDWPDRCASLYLPPAAPDFRARRSDPAAEPGGLCRDRRLGWPRPGARADAAASCGRSHRLAACAGAAGPGFPAGIKWETVRTAPGSRKYIVCNADEGDSGTFADRMLMEGDPVRADRGHGDRRPRGGRGHGLHLRPQRISACDRQAEGGDCADRRRASRRFAIEVRVGAGAYVCGEETSLLNSLEGKRGEVRAKPPLPALDGLFGCPTVVNNVLTLAAIPHILAEGGAALCDAGASNARTARCRSSSRAISSTAGCSRRRSASPCANWSTTSAAAPQRAPGQGGAGRRAARRLSSTRAISGSAVRLRGLYGQPTR